MDEYLTLRWSTTPTEKKEATVYIHYHATSPIVYNFQNPCPILVYSNTDFFLVKSTSWTVVLEDQPHVLARLACSIVLPTGIWNQFASLEFVTRIGQEGLW